MRGDGHQLQGWPRTIARYDTDGVVDSRVLGRLECWVPQGDVFLGKSGKERVCLPGRLGNQQLPDMHNDPLLKDSVPGL